MERAARLNTGRKTGLEARNRKSGPLPKPQGRGGTLKFDSVIDASVYYQPKRIALVNVYLFDGSVSTK